MADPPSKHHPISPISQLLHNLGMTRDDLSRHSDQMRQFLTTENANSLRAFAQERAEVESSTTPAPSFIKARSKSRSFSATDASMSSRPTPPPVTPVKAEPVEPSTSLRRYDSMEAVIERQNRKSKRGRRHRKTSPAPPRSPSFSGARMDAFMHERGSRRATNGDDPGDEDRIDSQVLLKKIISSSWLLTHIQDVLPPPPVTPHAGKYYRESVLEQTVIAESSTRKVRILSAEDHLLLTYAFCSFLRMFISRGPSHLRPHNLAGVALLLLEVLLLKKHQRFAFKMS